MTGTELQIGSLYIYNSGKEEKRVMYFKHSVNHRLFVNNNLEILKLAESSVKEFIHEFK